MKLRSIYRAYLNGLFLGAVAFLLMLVSCSENEINPNGGGSDNSGDGSEPTDTVYRGYADPAGTILLNCGDRITENGSITYIAPDGSITEDLYKKVNGTDLGNEAQALYLNNGKIYILCADYFRLEGKPGDGALIIVDAVTFKKEKCFRLEDLRFTEPEGITNPDFEPIPVGLSSLAVMDEHNIFICDDNGLYRFDSTTGELNLLEESFRVDNGGAGVAGRVFTRGLAIVQDKLYVAVGGWTSATDEYNLGIYEYEKGCNKLCRKLGIVNGGNVSAVCAGPDDTVWFVTYKYNNSGSNRIYRVDTKTMTVLDSKRVSDDLDSGIGNSLGVSVFDQTFYYSGMTTCLRRFDYQTGKSEQLVDAKDDESNANFVTCNPVYDAKKNLLYIATTEKFMEGVVSTDHILVYDCQVYPPVLKQKISGKTSYVVGIYPMSIFY